MTLIRRSRNRCGRESNTADSACRPTGERISVRARLIGVAWPSTFTPEKKRISEMLRDVQLSRPLGLGQLLDRGITLLVSLWPSVLTVTVIAMAPRAIEHFYTADNWVTYFGGGTEQTQGDSAPDIAMRVSYQLNQLSTSSVMVISSVIYYVLLFVMSGAVATDIAAKMIGRTSNIRRAFGLLSERWTTIGPTALLWAGGLYLVHYLATMLLSKYNSYVPTGNSQAILYFLSQPIVNFAFDVVQQAMLIGGVASSVAATLEANSVVEASTMGLAQIARKPQIGRTLVLAVVYALVFRLFGPFSLLPALALYATSLPALYAIVDIAIGSLPISFVLVTAVLYYMDARLRQGIDVASDSSLMSEFARHPTFDPSQSDR
jgi:hypothetical protein